MSQSSNQQSAEFIKISDQFQLGALTTEASHPVTANLSEVAKQDVSAALSDDRKTLTFSVLNPSDSQQSLNLIINGTNVASQGHLWRMAPDKLTAVNIVGQKPEVEVQEQELSSVPDTMSLPPFSISIYSFPLQ